MKNLIYVMLLWSINTMAFYLDCKDLNDPKTELKIFKNDSLSDSAFLNAQTHINGTPLGIIIKIKSPIIKYKYPPKTTQVKTIEWEDSVRDIKMSIDISDTILNDGREIELPLPFQSSIHLNGNSSGMQIINSDLFVCREYRNF